MALEPYHHDATQYWTRTVYAHEKADARDNYGRGKFRANSNVYAFTQFKSGSHYMQLWDKDERWGHWRCKDFETFGREYCRNNKGGDPFYVGKQTVEEIERDWQVGCMQDEVEEMSAAIRAKAAGLVVPRKRKRRYGPIGAEVDSDRWAHQQYDTAFVSRPRQGRKSLPIVSILTQWGGHCGITHEALRWNGVAATALADALTRSGWAVGLHIMCFHQSAKDKKTYSVYGIPVKQPHDVLNVGTVGAVACHPSTYRLLQFKLYQGMDWAKPGGGHGYPKTMDVFRSQHREMYDKIVDTYPGNTIVLETSHDESAAIKNVTDALDSIMNPMAIG